MHFPFSVEKTTYLGKEDVIELLFVFLNRIM